MLLQSGIPTGVCNTVEDGAIDLFIPGGGIPPVSGVSGPTISMWACSSIMLSMTFNLVTEVG